jgi:NADH-quinone oxidoreductase subunit N
MTVFMISLTGLPPTAGFIGKLMLFGSMIEGGGAFAVTLVVLGVLFSVVSLYYYARIVGSMFLVRPQVEAEPVRLSGPTYIILWTMTAGTIGFGLFPSWLMDRARVAVEQILTKI